MKKTMKPTNSMAAHKILYQDELPLRVEDMLDVEYDGYIYQRRGDESVFLGQYDLSQRT